MAADEKWYFTKEQLGNTPSRKCGIDADKELSYRQQAANFIQDMGQRLVVTQLCINTAIVYMHRFYVFHSLSQFHRNSIASAALFLAAKVEEQPRKLEHVIRVSHMCLYRDQTTLDTKSDQYLEQAQDLVFNENVLLQTLGFDVAIDHPHTHVVRCCQLVKASKDLAQTSYFMASNSLHLTTMCLQYKPTVVACFCIHLACKWSNWEIPQSNEGKHWFWYVDRTVTAELLQQLTAEFLHIFDKCPSRLKKKIMSMSEKQSPSMHHPSLPNSPFDIEPRKVNSPAPDGGPTFQSNRIYPSGDKDDKKPSTSGQLRALDSREYREKKERERLEREKLQNTLGPHPGMIQDLQKHHSHHHNKPPMPPGQNPLMPGKHPPPAQKGPTTHHNHHRRPDPTKAPTGPPLQSAQHHSQSRQRPPNLQAYNPHSSHPPHQKDPNHLDNLPGTASDYPQQSHQDSHQVPLDKSNSNNHSLHRRGYDPRHLKIEHRKEETKNYAKYEQQMRSERQKKPDSFEQRSEEVRKLIEKSIPSSKPRQEAPKEDLMANMVKQHHHLSKYPEKPVIQGNSGRNLIAGIAQPSHDFSKIPTQVPKQLNLPSHSSQNLQNPAKEKNGNLEEKKYKVEENSSVNLPPVKHKSLFSPDKVTPTREILPMRAKIPKQKTPPMVAAVPIKVMKHEKIGEISGMPEMPSIFENSPVQKRAKVEQPDIDFQMRLKMEDPGGFDVLKMLGKLPEPVQLIRDTAPSSTNGRGNELKAIEPLDSSFDAKHLLNNGTTMDNSSVRSELDQLVLERLEQVPLIKPDYLNPVKSTQGISALLQEPLAPMPSLLSSQDSGNYSQSQNLSLTNSIPSEFSSQGNSISTTSEIISVKEDLPYASTVDISALSVPVQISQLPENEVSPVVPDTVLPVVPQQEKKSDHHKSEKKKKKEKHKHKDRDKDKEKDKDKDRDRDKERDKDKDKSKDKHKHRHKDKDKEKHRSDKDRGVGDKAQKSEEISAIPIKITIPKDKLNFSAESSEKRSPSTKLTLKIPKEKLKTEGSIVQPDGQQGPLKITIRKSTGGIEFPETRKRERERDSGEGIPPQKKSSQGFVQKPTERQNGRHYSSNKEKHPREHKSSSKLSQSQQSHTT